jgi:di/tripeptidase
MATLERYVASFRAIKVIRSSKQVDDHLEVRAHRVALQAENMYRSLGQEVPVEVVQQGSDTKAPRARVAVIVRAANALKVEARHRILAGALDAARD